MERASVRIVGGSHLQNRVLCSYLSDKAGIECSAVSHSQFGKRDDPVNLVLLDYQDGSRNALLRKLLSSTTPLRPDVAVFRLPHGTDVNGLMAQPQLKGVFWDGVSRASLAEGIRAILAGELWLPRKLMAAFFQRVRESQKKVPKPATEPLTHREQEVLEMLCHGARNNTIAQALGVSPHTVKTHISNIFKKIDASSRLEAVNWARSNAGF